MYDCMSGKQFDIESVRSGWIHIYRTTHINTWSNSICTIFLKFIQFSTFATCVLSSIVTVLVVATMTVPHFQVPMFATASVFLVSCFYLSFWIVYRHNSFTDSHAPRATYCHSFKQRQNMWKKRKHSNCLRYCRKVYVKNGIHCRAVWSKYIVNGLGSSCTPVCVRVCVWNPLISSQFLNAILHIVKLHTCRMPIYHEKSLNSPLERQTFAFCIR